MPTLVCLMIGAAIVGVIIYLFIWWHRKNPLDGCVLGAIAEGPSTRSDIRSRLLRSPDPQFVSDDGLTGALSRLQTAGLIELVPSEISVQGMSRLTRYRLTERGEARVSRLRVARRVSQSSD